MGCTSSKLVFHQIKEQNPDKNEDHSTDHHVVLLTSSTYGALNLDDESHECQRLQKPELDLIKQQTIAESVGGELKKSMREPTEIINLWELMQGIEEELPAGIQFHNIPKSRTFSKKKFGGKENKGIPVNSAIIRPSSENSPRSTLKELQNLTKYSKKPFPKLWASSIEPNQKFDHFEIHVDSEEEENEEKKTVPQTTRPKCPPGGENSVVIYTTTLRGIRKTFDDCNVVRSIIESHNVRTIERDISMHSGFKEELRTLMVGSGEATKVPLVFVEGRLIGGAEEIVKLEEGGKLMSLFQRVPAAPTGVCGGCGGFRFVVCGVCDGSCRVLGEDGKRSGNCNECNENGLVFCPLCC